MNPRTMNAVRLREARGTDGLELEQMETPHPGQGELLVRVHAAAITRDELEWPTDRLPAIPSYELSGVGSPRARRELAAITKLVEAGDLRPAVDSVYPLDDARAAFERSLAPGKQGKVVLEIVEA